MGGCRLQTRKSFPPFAALRAFEAYGRLGGFRKAAQALNVDHAVISRHLRSLEALVGTALIERERNADHWLTAEGQVYHRQIADALSAIGRATEELRKRHQDRFLVWCSPGFANHWLMPRLPDFNERYPAIELALRPSDEGVKFTINEAEADIRYIRDWDAQSLPAGVHRLDLARPAIFPVASPAYLESVRTQLRTVKDFLNLRLLHEEGDQEWRAWLAAHDIAGGDPLPGPRLWHANLTLDAAGNGQGIALANRFLLSDSLAAGRLVPVVPSEEPLLPVELGGYNLTAREDRWTSVPLVRFRQWLQEKIAEPNVPGE
jgi:DNA-binding transcriptional LysR family regulator